MHSRKILVRTTLLKNVKIIFAGVVGPTKSVTLVKLNNIQTSNSVTVFGTQTLDLPYFFVRLIIDFVHPRENVKKTFLLIPVSNSNSNKLCSDPLGKTFHIFHIAMV